MFSTKTRKRLALFIFGFSLVLAIPPNLEFFTDIFLNLPIATFMSQKLGIKLLTGLIFSYTLIPLALIYIASLIHPANTDRTFSRFFIKIKNFFSSYLNLVKRKPVYLLGILVVIYLLWKFQGFYVNQINIFVLGGA